MIGVYKEIWEDIPVLIVVDAERQNTALPILTYFHGFTSAKEHNLPLAYLMAEKGYRVILLDSKLHGERSGNTSEQERQLQFFDIVSQNIKDLSFIRQKLSDQKLILNNRFGIAGTSMGGITTAAALTQFPWIKTAAVLMGSPMISDFARSLVNQIKQTNRELPYREDEMEQIYQSLAEIDLSKQLDKLNNRPLLFWHGEQDPVVPFNHSYRFYEQAMDYYNDPESIRFIREVNRGHKVSRSAILETVQWFEMQL